VEKKPMCYNVDVDASGLEFDPANIKYMAKCPRCNAEHMVTLGQIQRGKTITCTNCHKTIRLVDENKRVDKAVCRLVDSSLK